MKHSTKRIAALTAVEVLKTFVDLAVHTQRIGYRRRLALEYFKKRHWDIRAVDKKLSYLRTHGYIVDTVAGKERYLEVTAKGRAKISDEEFWTSLPRQPRWDKRWRIIIFDIPAKWNKTRRKFPRQLRAWGFIPIQRSIYAYPFECRKQINVLIEGLKLAGTVKYMIADIIEGEEDIIKMFIDNGTLTKDQVARSA